MRVLLIYPPITRYGLDPSEAGSIPPLGLASIAAYAERDGHEVRIVDALTEGFHNRTTLADSGGTQVGLSDDDISKRIEEFRPRVLGISIMFSAYAADGYRMAALAKAVDPTITVVVGGAHVNALTEHTLLGRPEIDLAILGEGELTFSEFLTRIDAGEDWCQIQGIAFARDNDLVRTESRPLIENLDDLPFPARHLLPMELYFSNHENPYVYRNRHTFMLASRGCPKRCIYCSIQSVWSHKWRHHSADYVVRQIEHLVRDYGVGEIHFVDDNLTANPKTAMEIFQTLIERKLDVKWTCPNGTAIWTLDEKLLDVMKTSGCYRLTFGIEAASKETQAYIRKNLNTERARAMLSYANKIGIWTVSTFIFGFPHQTKEDMQDSIRYAISSGTDFATFYSLMPFPKTELWEILKKEDLINEGDFFENIGYYLSTRGLDTTLYKSDEIREMTHLGYKRMLSTQVKRLITNPGHYFRKINSVDDFRYFCKLLGNFLFMARTLMKSAIFGKNRKVGGTVYWQRKAVQRE
ncbi:Radical SAM domain protein [Paramagnetospirillum magnetotacticum MS-1]|uniref:Radical SAM domain protein n=1 Tax=Paramagnetospirillum magnetotacticum MS-1 TaxID=272627 RepID=A0A0C2UDK1_PARME|nr:radical SAM protein [Paramagnetospirillum magnetotacticum]KIL99572.1 Radical SAM domain protein [Paramagnetospirillum magnetotacticum MS-1]